MYSWGSSCQLGGRTASPATTDTTVPSAAAAIPATLESPAKIAIPAPPTYTTIPATPFSATPTHVQDQESHQCLLLHIQPPMSVPDPQVLPHADILHGSSWSLLALHSGILILPRLIFLLLLLLPFNEQCHASTSAPTHT